MARRDKASGGIRQRDGKWIASVEGNPDPVTGKRRRIQRSAPTKSAAQIELQKLFTMVRTRQDRIVAGNMKLGDWLDQWLEDREHRMRPSSIRRYRVDVEHIQNVIGNIRLDKLTKNHVKRMSQELQATQSAGVARSCHELLHNALADAIRVDLLQDNVAGEKGPNKAVAKKKKRDRLSAQQAAWLITYHRSNPYVSRWIVALMTGMRQGEVLGLRWSDIDFDTGIIHVRKQLIRVPTEHGCETPCGRTRSGDCPDVKYILGPDKDEYEHLEGTAFLGPVKSDGSFRTFPIPRFLLQVLLEYREQTEWGRNPHNLVWRYLSVGDPIAASMDYKWWKQALAEAGLPEVTLHSARQTAASVLVSMGLEISQVQRILGHSNISMTEVYSDVDIEAIRESMNRFGVTLEAGVEDPPQLEQ
ncbi:integrase [Gordonia phage Yvonnetastic]|uniref:Integrase n=1 Tax=Gordonia phage Yvonnetastic TaxID=1821566 RepID=A0A142K956_9CAUD|nr:integrase [Gordonia phage Yvonnetastic]AMS02639.1 integrase [Gordonia phage Yvonnetastic]